MCTSTQQTNSSENGVWVVGTTPQELKRPTKYLNAPGRQYYVTAGDTRKGTLYVCTTIGTATEIQPILSRPILRETQEEQVYAKAMVQSEGGVRASRLSGPTTEGDDAATKAYISGLDVDARSAKRIRLGTTDVQADISANADYVRNILGIGTGPPLECQTVA